jgi:hypothetical protein
MTGAHKTIILSIVWLALGGACTAFALSPGSHSVDVVAAIAMAGLVGIATTVIVALIK